MKIYCFLKVRKVEDGQNSNIYRREKVLHFIKQYYKKVFRKSLREGGEDPNIYLEMVVKFAIYKGIFHH